MSVDDEVTQEMKEMATDPTIRFFVGVVTATDAAAGEIARSGETTEFVLQRHRRMLDASPEQSARNEQALRDGKAVVNVIQLPNDAVIVARTENPTMRYEAATTLMLGFAMRGGEGPTKRRRNAG